MTDEATRLLLAAGEGDRLALAGFIRATQADVWRYCAHLLDPASADDLVQETYLRAMRTASTFRGDAPALRWLLTIARRAVADEIRRRQRRRGREVVRDTSDREDDLDGSGTPSEAELFVASEHLTGLLEELPEERREAFVLTQVVGLSYAEAADVADVPIGTIRSRVARARESLVAALEEGGSGR